MMMLKTIDRVRSDRDAGGATLRQETARGSSKCLYVVDTPNAHGKRGVWPHLRTLLPHTCRLRNEKQIVTSFLSAHKDSVWLAFDTSFVLHLANEVHEPKGEQRLLLFQKVAAESQHFLNAYFRFVLPSMKTMSMLPLDQLPEVLIAPNSQDLFIAVTADPDKKAVLLYRGNMEPLVIPLDWFVNGTKSPTANQRKFALDDYGQTVRFGEFEAAADAILYEFDRDFRRRARQVEIKTDKSLGASLRRLRLQKGVARSDFPGIADKTIARLERNEIVKPHDRTLAAIARKLDVPVEDLGTY
jgi:hypothetical protein